MAAPPIHMNLLGSDSYCDRGCRCDADHVESTSYLSCFFDPQSGVVDSKSVLFVPRLDSATAMPPTPTFNVSHHRTTTGVPSTSSSTGPSVLAGGLSAMLGSTMNGWISASPVETLVARACDPSLSDPPYPVHLELAEYINKKKANTYVCSNAPVPRL